MSLPKRNYFYLDELAEAWNIKSWDIDHMIERGDLRVHVWRESARVTLGFLDKKENADGYYGTLVYDVGDLETPGHDHTVDCQGEMAWGLFMIYPSDCRKVLQHGHASVTFIDDRKSCWDSHTEFHYCRFDDDGGFDVTKSALVVSVEERARCEDVYSLVASQQVKNEPIPLSVYAKALYNIAGSAFKRRS